MKLQVRTALTLSVLALVAALSGVAGSIAATQFITSKQIRNGTIKSIDLRNGGIKGVDVKNDAINSPDLATGAVESQALDLPAPTQCDVEGEAKVVRPLDYTKIIDLCTYVKSTSESILQVDWTGTIEGKNGGELTGCIFQLRVNDAPSAQGGGEVFGKGLAPVSATALFTGLPAGPIVVSVYAKLANPAAGGEVAENYCTIGPAKAGGVKQTVSVSEQVV